MFTLEVGPLSGAHGRTIISSSSSIRSQKLCLGANFSTKPSISCYPRSMLLCRASPNKRNVSFSKQQRGSSRSKIRQNPEKGNSEDPEDNLHRNGTMTSFSYDQRYSATSTPGQREKEIVELFKNIQAQLRERAATKEEKRVDAVQQGPGGRGTVDSLLQLLRKHSAAQGKKSTGGDGYDPNQPESANSLDESLRTDPFEEEDNVSFFGDEDGVCEPNRVPSNRPVSSFRRRSPIPVPKKTTDGNVEARQKLEPELQQQHELEPVESSMAKLEPSDDESSMKYAISDASDSDETELRASESPVMLTADLSSMTVSELKGVAKSRGIKGYSKLKKNELLELLSIDRTGSR